MNLIFMLNFLKFCGLRFFMFFRFSNFLFDFRLYKLILNHHTKHDKMLQRNGGRALLTKQ